MYKIYIQQKNKAFLPLEITENGETKEWCCENTEALAIKYEELLSIYPVSELKPVQELEAILNPVIVDDKPSI